MIELKSAANSCCTDCYVQIFTFNVIIDENDFILAIIDLSAKHSLFYLSDKIFSLFEMNDNDHSTRVWCTSRS